MADRNDIVVAPNKLLRTPSKRISVIDASVKRLIKDMVAVGSDWEDHRPHEICVGLAAIQIGEPRQVVIVRDRTTDERRFEVMINPRIIKTYGKMMDHFDGCLSVRDVYGLVSRFSRVKFSYLDAEGKKQIATAEGFDAILIQHEIDHLKGVLFVDHIKDDPEVFRYITTDGQIERADYEAIKAAGIFR